MIKFSADIRAFSAGIANAKKQTEFAAAVALTKTAKRAQADMPAALQRALDQPTAYTQRGTYITPARRDKPEAVIGFKDRQAKYMAYQIAGGVYNPGAAGIKLPGDITLNTFGNIPRGTIAKLKAAAKGGSLSNAIARRLGREIDSGSAAGDTAYQRLNMHGNRRKRAAPIQLFMGRPAGKGWENAPMGIWRRIPPASPGGKGKLVPVIVFEDTPARYRARFDMRGMVAGVAARYLQTEFNTALDQALRTAR